MGKGGRTLRPRSLSAKHSSAWPAGRAGASVANPAPKKTKKASPKGFGRRKALVARANWAVASWRARGRGGEGRLVNVSG